MPSGSDSTGNARGLIRQLTAAIADGVPPWAEVPQVPPPSRRRPRRPDVVRYQVRVELTGTKPPLWRRLELASDLFLDEVHDAIQAAFGWTDSHLHQFGSGPAYYSPETEYYLCPFEPEDAEPGVLEELVRLDEVLAEPGDVLFYLYDFGDSWEHVIELESVMPARDAPAGVCLGGERDGPPEDCGGVHVYEVISAASDPLNPERDAASAEYERIFGVSLDVASYGPVPFDLAAVNAALASRFPPGPRPERLEPPDDLPAPLRELLDAVRNGWAKRELRWLIGAALAPSESPDLAVAEQMVRPYVWLLDRVGDTSIRLTSAGYLPPAVVQEAVALLDIDKEWISKGNREVQTLPVLNLRESATKAGLLRKQHGMLLLTSAGRKLRTDPAALWQYLAARMPVKSAERIDAQGGLIWMIAVAARAGGDLNVLVARILNGIGWTTGGGYPLSPEQAGGTTWHVRDALRRLGGMSGSYIDEDGPNADGVAFARAAVRSWPAVQRGSRD